MVHSGVTRGVTEAVTRGVTDARVSGGAAPETPLQAAAIFAYDMQEASGPLLPAKGGLEIAAFGSPGTADGPASGITSRSLVAASSQYFEHADNAFFRAPTTGVKTIRVWVWGVNNSPDTTQRPMLFKANSIVASDAGSEWAANEGNTVPGQTIVNFNARQADDSARHFVQSSVFGAAETWRRVELLFDTDSDAVTPAPYITLRRGTETPSTIAVPGGFFQGTNPFRIGRALTTYFNGRIALLCAWNRALTADERAFDQTPRTFADLGTAFP